MIAIALVERIGCIAEASPQLLDHLLVRLARGSSEDPLVDQQPCDRPRIGHGKPKCCMMPMIELPEGKAGLVLLFADQLPEGQAAERRAQPFIARLLGRDPKCRRRASITVLMASFSVSSRVRLPHG